MNIPVISNQSDRPAYDVLGDRYTLLFSSKETGGAYSMFEFHVPTGHGTPPHIHTLEDESFYVLSGELDFMIDGKTVRAKSGDVIFGPRNIAHNFTCVSETPARLICITSPGGFEHFFAAAGSLVTDKSQPARPPAEADVKKLMETAPRFGLTILGP